MKVAIPIANGALCAHFGHCQQFAFLELNESGEILNREDLVPPPHAPGVIPKWVAENKAEVVLAGGMGGMAIQIFEQNGVRVVTGCQPDQPEAIVKQFAEGTLLTGANTCNHDQKGSGGGHDCGH